MKGRGSCRRDRLMRNKLRTNTNQARDFQCVSLAALSFLEAHYPPVSI